MKLNVAKEGPGVGKGGQTRDVGSLCNLSSFLLMHPESFRFAFCPKLVGLILRRENFLNRELFNENGITCVVDLNY